MISFIEVLQLPVVSGVMVPFISFAFGYFLFKAQRREETRLEVFRRRLNAYEEVSAFIQEVDEFAHENVPSHSDQFRERRELLTKRCFNLVYSIRLYLPLRLSETLANLDIYGLPKSLVSVEQEIGEINDLIEEEVGKHLLNSNREMKKLMEKYNAQKNK